MFVDRGGEEAQRDLLVGRVLVAKLPLLPLRLDAQVVSRMLLPEGDDDGRDVGQLAHFQANDPIVF